MCLYTLILHPPRFVEFPQSINVTGNLELTKKHTNNLLSPVFREFAPYRGSHSHSYIEIRYISLKSFQNIMSRDDNVYVSHDYEEINKTRTLDVLHIVVFYLSITCFSLHEPLLMKHYF